MPNPSWLKSPITINSQDTGGGLVWSCRGKFMKSIGRDAFTDAGTISESGACRMSCLPCLMSRFYSSSR